GIGSCGFQDTNDDQLVVALSKEVMSQGSYCGKQIKVTSKKGSVHLKVIDTCPGCARGDVDMSKAAFDKIGDYDKGHVDISWNF
ncbi:RlpA-like double-psi beta-barrel-protein domain-containing protein-containing protein, partial [Mycotypha africana]|uniref:RlpA-like double-psi beta-barrel-protein domain-containing protein-containing protein n=1 Tax=Mycotypha africana TaxID=64632 RepID=UPI0022FFE4AF